MTLLDFLELHQGGEAQGCVSIEYNGKYVFEEADQEEILKSDRFKDISTKIVDHFCAIRTEGRVKSAVELIIDISD